MASKSSKSNTKISTIKINSPHCSDITFDTPIPSCPWKEGHRFTIGLGPGDPEDLPEVFDKVRNTSEGFFKSFVKMFDNLGTDGYRDLAMEIGDLYADHGVLLPVVTMTGIIDEYAEAGKTAEALHVYRIMLDSEDCAPNAYTYSVIVKALAADPDPNFHVVAKEFVMEMMGKGWQPNASTYTSVFEAFAGQEKMEEAKQFLEEMKANGFVADKKAMRAFRKVLKVKGPVVKSIFDILFDNFEDYSDDDDDDVVKKCTKDFDWSKYPPESYVPFSKKQVIEDDPENPKNLEQKFDTMRRTGALVSTVTRMLNMLRNDGFLSQAEEIRTALEVDHNLPEVVTHTGVIEIYGRHDEAKHALKVFLRMLSLGVSPNAYTYSVLIKALAKDSNFLGDAKKYLLEMMDKGMQPNARTYTPVFKAFARLEQDNVKKGKEFLMEMEAMGFRANKKAVMEVLKDRKGPVIKTVIKILFGK
ncbi:pentatricopeptide repeat-containing protein [Rosa sericea]